MIKNYPVIPWIGGKRRLSKHILPMFPVDICYTVGGSNNRSKRSELIVKNF